MGRKPKCTVEEKISAVEELVVNYYVQIIHTIKEQTFCVICPSNYALFFYCIKFRYIHTQSG